MRERARLLVIVIGLWLGTLHGGVEPVTAATEVELQSAVFRAKPAVVMVVAQVEATATVRCGAAGARTARSGPITELGSGSIIHPDGWIVTNGHVVQPVQEGLEGAVGNELLSKAIGVACREELAALSASAREERIRILVGDPRTREGATLERRLWVNLSNGQSFDAQIKHYSPPAYVIVRRAPDGAPEHGRDVAVLKIAGRDLPVVRLATRSSDLHLGQTLFVIGYPGVVTSHELLSKETQFEASITTGRVSGFRRDIGGQQVIQTDAAIIQGNSGGPVFDDRGDVVGAATFTSLQGNQVVQGFNFLIPVETIQAAALAAGVTPVGESAFTRLWNRGVDFYVRDLHFRAYRNLRAAAELHPGFPDVERVRQDCDIRAKAQPFLHREEVQWALLALAVVGILAGGWFGARSAVSAARRGIRRIVQEELKALRS
jgi:S1-C subfamily serine protease